MTSVAVGDVGAARASAAKVTTVNVTVRDTRFALSRKTSPVGQVRFVVKNVGTKPHSFQILAKKTPVLSKGKTARLTLTFKRAGKYRYISTVKGDTARGLSGIFTLTAPPKPATPGNAKLGKPLFVANCGTCHTLKPAATHGTIGPKLDSTKLTFAAIVKIVTNGKSSSAGAMPPFKGNLTTNQIQDVSAFVYDATH